MVVCGFPDASFFNNDLVVVCGFPDASFFNNDLAYQPLLALQLIDGLGIPVTQSHLNEFKRLYQIMDFSKFAVTGAAGIPGGPGATSWRIIESTMTRGKWEDLGVKITGLMKILTEDWVNPYAAGPLVQFTSVVFDGRFLVSRNNIIYVATWKREPIPGSNAAISARPTLITNVYFNPSSIAYERYRNTFFDNAKAVVAKAIGAVFSGNLVEKIATRLVGQSISQAIEGISWGGSAYGSDYNVLRIMSGMGGLAYIKSKKSWKAVLAGYAGVPLGDELSTSLEKLRKKVDKNELQRYIPAPLLSAQDIFTMLKVIAAKLVEMVAGFSDAATPGLIFPASFIENVGDLKTSLDKETPEAYTAQVWDAKIESYIIRLGGAVDVLDIYHGGRFMQLNAIEQARYQYPEAEVIDPVALVALQDAADLLSKIAITKGNLRHIAQRNEISRDLRYSYKTGRVKFNGIRQNLTIVKIKERGSKAMYIAFSPNPRRFPLVNECLE